MESMGIVLNGKLKLEPMIESSSTPGLVDLTQSNNNQISPYHNIKDSLTTLNDELTKAITNFKTFSELLENKNKNLFGYNGNGNGNGGSGLFGNGIDFKRIPKNQAIAELMTVAGVGASIYQGYQARERTRLNGDWYGADIQGKEVAGGALSKVGGVISSLALPATLVASPLAGLIVGGVGAAVSGIGMGVNTSASKDRTEETKFKNILNQDKGNIAMANAFVPDYLSNNYAENTYLGKRLYTEANSYNKGTGLKDGEFSSLVTSLGKNGVENFGYASQKVAQAANIANRTNGDVNEITGLMGLFERYGDSADAVLNAYNKKELAGFSNVQFDELVDSLSSALQDGITKGFTINSNAIVSTQQSLAKASNNDVFWSGKEGSVRVSELRNAMSNATGLNSTNDMLLYRAVNSLGEDKIKELLGSDYVEGSQLNALTLMEQGNLSPEILKALNGQLQETYNGDTDSIISVLTGIFGNRTKASQYYKMMNNIDGTTGEIDTTTVDKLTSASTVNAEIENKNMLDNYKELNDTMKKLMESNNDAADKFTKAAIKIEASMQLWSTLKLVTPRR